MLSGTCRFSVETDCLGPLLVVVYWSRLRKWRPFFFLLLLFSARGRTNLQFHKVRKIRARVRPLFSLPGPHTHTVSAPCPPCLRPPQGRHVAAIPLRPWENEAAVMAPLEHQQQPPSPNAAGHGRRGGRSAQSEEGARGTEGLNLHGQVLAWSDDGR